MNKLTRRAYFYLAAATLGTAASVAIFILRPPCWKLSLITALAVTLIIVFLFVKLKKSIVDARLIIDNQIIHIQPAVIKEQSEEKRAAILPGELIEVFVSCFGILLDSKIIKFNQDGILLKTVEIGRDFISLTYGTEKRTQNTRLLRAAMENGELERIIQRFRYETGVVPTVTN